MDLQQMTDVTALKALAFDEIQRLEVTQQNLRLINQRIAELQAAPEDVAEKATAKK